MPWSIDMFETYRPHVCSFVDTNIVHLIRNKICNRILVRAPVKSGKRVIAEYIAMRDKSTEPVRVHAFISAWHRTADESQRIELGKHNLQVFSINNTKNAAECIRWILAQAAAGLEIVIHLDECDYGTGERQILGRVWRAVRNLSGVTAILYSATPEEVIFSEEINGGAEDDDDMMAYSQLVDDMDNNGLRVEYTPVYYDPAVSTTTGFCGPSAFLDAGLVTEATPFYRTTETGTVELTPQGRTIIREFLAQLETNPSRNVLILRLSYIDPHVSPAKSAKDRKALYQFLRNLHLIPELARFDCLVDKDTPSFDVPSSMVSKQHIEWACSKYWRRMASGEPILIVLDQTSTRSTEWKCHHRIYAVHDYRNSIQFATVSQAQERVNHYADSYGGFQPIRMYGNVNTFKLSARRITYATYIADAALSSRVSGSIRKNAIVKTTFYPCDPSTFSAVIASEEFRAEAGTYTPENPFRNPRLDEDGRFMAALRKWRSFEYEDVLEDARWGFDEKTCGPRITVCYKEGVLGIALRTFQGIETVNTLTAYRTMYRTRTSGVRDDGITAAGGAGV